MNLYRDWRPDYGQRAGDAHIVEAASENAAVEREHERDWEAGDQVVFCVQRVHKSTYPHGRILRGDKVRVVRSRREVVPVFIAETLTTEQIKARCPGSSRRFLDLEERPGRGQCRRCAVRSYMRQGKVKVSR